MFDCNTENGQRRHNPVTGDEAIHMVAELMNIPAELIGGFVVLTIHECDKGCYPPHLVLTSSNLHKSSQAYILQAQLNGMREQWTNNGGTW
jgi:hypothetical protein